MRTRTNQWSIYYREFLVGTLYEVTEEVKAGNKVVEYIEHEIQLEAEWLDSVQIRDISNLGDSNGYIDPVGTEVFISERVIPKTRVNIEDILKEMGMSEYDAWEIFRKKYGRTYADYIYVDFDNHGKGNRLLKNWKDYFPRLNY